MTARLRQLAFVAADLEAATVQLRTALGLEVAHRDPSVGAFGLVNIVCPIGDQDFLEVVSPIAPDVTAARYLARRGGDAGYMVIFEVDDGAAARAIVEELGVRVVAGFEGAGHGSLQLHPKDCGGTFVSLDWTSGNWAAAGPDWRAHVDTTRVLGFHEVEVAVTDAAGVAARWSTLTEAALVDGALVLENCTVRFVEVSDPAEVGVRRVAVRAAVAELVGTGTTVCGVPFAFVEGELP